jgi:hypothetical protein
MFEELLFLTLERKDQIEIQKLSVRSSAPRYFMRRDCAKSNAVPRTESHEGTSVITVATGKQRATRY